MWGVFRVFFEEIDFKVIEEKFQYKFVIIDFLAVDSMIRSQKEYDVSFCFLSLLLWRAVG